jgi:hypothetical protein
MQIQETFTVAAPAGDGVEVLRGHRAGGALRSRRAVRRRAWPDRYQVLATQKVGFISATFEMATQIESKDPLRSLALSSVGKSVKGAIGNLRSKDRVDFEPPQRAARA